MKLKPCLLAGTLAALLSAGAAARDMSAADAEDLLERRGFREVGALHYDAGLWHTTARDERGEFVDVTIDPRDEKVTAVRSTTRTTVTTVPVPPPTTIVREVEVPVVVEKPVVVERVTETPVVVERVVEPPLVRSPIVVQERVLVPMGGRIGKDVVAAVLHGAGYHDVHDIDWLSHRNLWKAEARDPSGDDREVHVDPYDGRIVHVEDD